MLRIFLISYRSYLKSILSELDNLKDEWLTLLSSQRRALLLPELQDHREAKFPQNHEIRGILFLKIRWMLTSFTEERWNPLKYMLLIMLYNP